MAISTNTNPIIICKGKRITTLAELQDNFDISKVCAYAKGGRLSQWLISIGEGAVNEEIQGIDFSLPEEMLAEDLMVLLGLSEEQQHKVITTITPRNTVDKENTVAEKENEFPDTIGETPLERCSTSLKNLVIAVGKDAAEKMNDTFSAMKIGKESDQKSTKNLSPILRKVMVDKEFVMNTIQKVLHDDCSSDEIKWNTDLPVEIGISDETLFLIYEQLGLLPINYVYTYPFAMFLQVIHRNYPARYGHIDVSNLGSFESALMNLGKDAVALGFTDKVTPIITGI